MFFTFNDTATTEIYTLSLHDALPIWDKVKMNRDQRRRVVTLCKYVYKKGRRIGQGGKPPKLWAFSYDDLDRKSTRLNSSHVEISYAVFCLKKKKKRKKMIKIMI